MSLTKGSKKSTKRERSSNKWCPDCVFKRHGKNHVEGLHHKNGKKQ